MLDANQLHRLAQLDAHPHSIISLYLGLDSLRDLRGLALGEMFKRKERQMHGNGAARQWDELADDRERILRYVDDLPTDHGRGLALFSGGKAGVFQSFALATPLANRLEVGPAPYIRPLAALATEQRRCLTVLVDRKSARMFESFMGAVDELDMTQPSATEGFFEPNGGQGRTGDNQVARWEEQNAARFFKEVTNQLRQVCQKLDCRQIIIGGARMAVDDFRGQLPGDLAQMVAGSFVLDCGAPLAQVAQAIAEAQEQARRKRQEKLLHGLAEDMGPGGKVATGLNQVLASLYEGQVRTLFVKDDFQAAGGVCPGCNRLRHVAEACPICGQAMTPVADVVNLAVARALESGARLEHVAEESPLDGMGSIAATLRYA